MILYNVTVKVETAVQETWLQWMREIHIPQVMATGKFTGHRLCRILHEEPDGTTYAIQYTAPDLSSFMRYQQENAQQLQADHREKFGNHVVVFRTLMEILEETAKQD